MSGGPVLLTEGLEEALHDLARSAVSTLHVVSPFVKAARLEALLDRVGSGVGVEVTTRWRPEEVAAGVSDLEAFEVCVSRGARLRLLDRLHAKLFVADGVRALVGSANLTGRGLGSAADPNLEVLVPLEPARRPLALLLSRLAAEGRDASAEERDEVAALARLIAPAEKPPRPADRDRTPVVWLPGFRSPDRLRAVYDGLGEGPPEPGDAAAVADLVALGAPADLDRAGFEPWMRDALRRQPVVVALERHLSRPRRFGELTSWLRAFRPQSTHEERQRLGQTLLRWLTCFDGERFRLDAPGWTEVLSLTESGRNGPG